MSLKPQAGHNFNTRSGIGMLNNAAAVSMTATVLAMHISLEHAMIRAAGHCYPHSLIHSDKRPYTCVCILLQAHTYAYIQICIYGAIIVRTHNVCKCMIHVHIHKYIHIHTCMCMYIQYTHGNVQTHSCICIYTYSHMCMYIYICVYICTNTHGCVYSTYTHRYTHTPLYIDVYTHMHTYLIHIYKVSR